ncbi:NAD-dependent epimerase/dehydratase family protein [Georgenia sp. SUBG003]|uniref:polysaccharide biosynthesis C-terminal domain-containing protein n=1 Tax=Georgenia sp. SUBG003 TaxID=1497974 RepID=UPI003AB12FC5
MVYANSTQSLNDSPYGRGKAKAADLLRDTAHSVGASFLDVILPNLFGEHGRSDYNSFVATFVHRVISEQSPTVQDKPITLLHAQDAAQALIDGLTASFGAEQLAPTSTATTVGEVLRTLKYQFGQYRSGDIPALASNLEVRLFNTLRAAMFQTYPPVPLHRHVDSRGSLVETVRAHGSEGQTFFSSTRPGVTRGQHFHLRKIERFVVVGGQARISLRRVLTDETITFDVDGDEPCIIDMPTLWAHNITNTGSSELATIFWTNELFDPTDPDTYREEV